MVPPRPFTVGELLDGAFTIYRRNFVTLFGVALVPQVPLVALWLASPLWFAQAAAVEAVVWTTQLLAAGYSVLIWPLVLNGATFGTMRAYEGGRPGLDEALRVAVRKLIPTLLSILVASWLVMIGFILFLIPGLILLTMMFALVPAIVVENRGPLSALDRSRRLSRGGRLRILGVLIVAWAIMFLPTMAYSMVAGATVGFGAMLGGDLDALARSGWLGGLAQAGGVVVGALTTPFLAAVMTLQYVDRRARTEAPELEDAIGRLGSTG